MKAFRYFKASFKLTSDMYGTGTETSLYAAHVLQKAKKMIKEANRLQGKVTKALAKYKGADISESKEAGELKGIIRRYQEVLGKKDEIPNTVDELLAYSKDLETEFDELCQKGEQMRATVFMRGADGKPIISTHMVVGNLGENLKTVVNNSTEEKANKILPSKVAVGEVISLDVKPIEEFMTPSIDIYRNQDGTPKIFERPIRFDRMGKQEVAIAASEVLPAGAEFSCHLRVRADSPLCDDNGASLKYLLDMGKNNGLGAWRGKGGKGQFRYKLEEVETDPSAANDGWN